MLAGVAYDRLVPQKAALGQVIGAVRARARAIARKDQAAAKLPSRAG